ARRIWSFMHKIKALCWDDPAPVGGLAEIVSPDGASQARKGCCRSPLICYNKQCAEEQVMAKEPTKLVGGMVGAAGGYTDGHTITTGDERRFWGVQTLLKAQIHELVADPTIGLMGIPYDGANSRTP